MARPGQYTVKPFVGNHCTAHILLVEAAANDNDDFVRQGQYVWLSRRPCVKSLAHTSDDGERDTAALWVYIRLFSSCGKVICLIDWWL